MDAHRKGDLTAAIVVAELKRRGIPVSRPIGDNERYDLIAESQEDLWKLQVKTGRLGNSVIRFSGSSQHTNTRDHTYDQYDDVDYFLVYCDDLAELYLVPERKVGYRMQLRVNDPEQQDSSITWAKTYQFDNIWPPGERVTSVTAASTVMLDHLNEYDIPLYLPSHCGVSHEALVEAPDDDVWKIAFRRGWSSTAVSALTPGTRPSRMKLTSCSSSVRNSTSSTLSNGRAST